jgi:hypothetical protein
LKKNIAILFGLQEEPKKMKKIENIGIQIEEIRSKYPKETQDIEDEEEGDWHHGFNSGMLAAVRHLKNPKKDFPSLCT